MDQAIEFYYFPMSPPARAVWMVLEELGIEYNENLIDIVNGKQKNADYKKINFRQKVPAIRHGDLCLAESRAIAGYLLNEYGAQCNKQQLYPLDARRRAVVDQHLYISENTFDEFRSYVNVLGVIFDRGQTKLENVCNVKSALGSLDTFLGSHTYTAADHLTIADFFYYTAVGLLEVTDYDDWADFPKVNEWKKKMENLPYHKKTCEDPVTQMRALYQRKLKENAQKK